GPRPARPAGGPHRAGVRFRVGLCGRWPRVAWKPLWFIAIPRYQPEAPARSNTALAGASGWYVGSRALVNLGEDFLRRVVGAAGGQHLVEPVARFDRAQAEAQQRLVGVLDGAAADHDRRPPH